MRVLITGGAGYIGSSTTYWKCRKPLQEIVQSVWEKMEIMQEATTG